MHSRVCCCMARTVSHMDTPGVCGTSFHFWSCNIAFARQTTVCGHSAVLKRIVYFCQLKTKPQAKAVELQVQQHTHTMTAESKQAEYKEVSGVLCLYTHSFLLVVQPDSHFSCPSRAHTRANTQAFSLFDKVGV